MKFTDLREHCVDLIDAGISVQLRSAPGRGKSEFVEELVKHLSARDGEEWGFSVAFLATYTPPDLVGYQFKGELEYDGRHVTVTDPSMPLWMITRQGKPTWAYKRGIVFLDEYGQGEADVKRASAELLLNKRIGKWQLGEGWGVIAASNRTSDRSGVTKEFDFVINRRAEIEITDDIAAWEDWAVQHGVMPLTVAFAHQNPHIVFSDGVPDKQGPWCTPRSLVMVDRLLRAKAARNGGSVPDDPPTQEAVRGIMGEGEAAQYFAFVRLEREMPKYEKIVAEPLKVKVPEKPDAQMLVCYNLAHRVNKDDAPNVVKYVERMPKEFAVTFAQAACKRDITLVTTPAFVKWSIENASLMAAIAR
jgi:hypothetical protein